MRGIIWFGALFALCTTCDAARVDSVPLNECRASSSSTPPYTITVVCNPDCQHRPTTGITERELISAGIAPDVAPGIVNFRNAFWHRACDKKVGKSAAPTSAPPSTEEKTCDLSKLPRDVSDFVVRDGRCAVVADTAAVFNRQRDLLQREWKCNSLEADRAALSSKHRDDRAAQEMMNHRNCVLKIGFTGVMRVP